MMKRRHLIATGGPDGNGDERDQPERAEDHTSRMR
jgi:hypothetical protein